MMEKTFGRGADNTNQIVKDDISRYHARITMLPDGKFKVEDRAAYRTGDTPTPNGTFVNGSRVLSVTVNPDAEVRLSDTVIDLKKIFGISLAKPVEKADPKDFTIEFSNLKSVYEQYKQERRDVISKHNLKTSVIRGVFTLLPLILFKVITSIFLKNSSPSELNEFSKNYIVFSVIGSTVGVMLTGNMSPTEKLEALDEDFRVQYVCPSCHTSLGSLPWTFYHEYGKCQRCEVVYKK